MCHAQTVLVIGLTSTDTEYTNQPAINTIMLKNLFLQKNIFDSFFDVGGKVLKATELLRNRERERERESGDCRPSPRSAPLWRSGELEIMNEGKTLFPSHWPLPLPAQLLILETRCHNGLHLPARVFHQFTIIALINIEYRKKY